jgi:hypothetical protein
LYFKARKALLKPGKHFSFHLVCLLPLLYYHWQGEVSENSSFFKFGNVTYLRTMEPQRLTFTEFIEGGCAFTQEAQLSPA